MKEKKCIECAEKKRCKDTKTSWIFFILGLIATLAIRVVTLLMDIDPIYGKTAWYIGVGGFLLFFLYQYNINKARHKLISERKLIDKVEGLEKLSEEDYKVIGPILCSLSSNKERINYFFIFLLSAIALILAIYFDFIH